MSAKRKETKIVREAAPETITNTTFYGIHLDEEQMNFANAIWSKENDIIFVNAKAGTGKTLVATGVANLLHEYGFYRNIIYIMSPYGEKKQGWLPGSIEEKSSVYFEQFYQALLSIGVNYSQVLTSDIENLKRGTAYISCITDTFLRGQNLDDAVVIVDEAQNFTTSQLKKILTRVNANTKVIVIGHTLQCDLDDKSLSGFSKYIAHFRNQNRCAVCTLTNNHRGWISQHADELEE